VAAQLSSRLRGFGLPARVVQVGPLEARDGGAAWLVSVELGLDGKRLRASGTVFALPDAIWSDQPLEVAHLHAEAPLDAELSAYQEAAQPQARTWQVRTFPLGDFQPHALAVGDVDGDGRPELLAASSTELVALDLSSGALAERFRLPLKGRPAAIRPRLDVVAVALDGGATIVRTSRLAEAIKRDGHGVLTQVRGFPFPGFGACELEPGLDVFTASSCTSPAFGLPPRFWNAAASGGAVVAIVPGAPGTLSARLGEAAPLELHEVGAQLALGALDGRPVVVTTAATLPGAADALTVRALEPGLSIVHRTERLLGGVRAVAVGDLDGDGRGAIVAALFDEANHVSQLWLCK
jgi:hypothetical protein